LFDDEGGGGAAGFLRTRQTPVLLQQLEIVATNLPKVYM
jgi:hypothetical protein